MDEGHNHRVRIESVVQSLTNPIFHDDRKSIERCASLEASHLLGLEKSELERAECLRLTLVPIPVLMLVDVPFQTVSVRWLARLVYTLQRSCAVAMLSIELLDRRLRSAP